MLTLLAIGTLSSGVLACANTRSAPSRGSSGSSGTDPGGAAATTTLAVASRGSYLKSDADGDADDRPHSGPVPIDQNELPVMKYGASHTERRAIVAVVKSYFAAAAAADGKAGCQLIDSNLGTALGQEQTGLPAGDSGTCAATLSLLFKRQQGHFVAENPTTMVVTGVHVRGEESFVTLGFKTMPESDIILQHEGNAWKIDALFDSPLT
jgi:hypothetical protein